MIVRLANGAFLGIPKRLPSAARHRCVLCGITLWNESGIGRWNRMNRGKIPGPTTKILPNTGSPRRKRWTSTPTKMPTST